MDALHYLEEIKEAGDITEVGLVNFDAARTDEICTQFPGLIVSNQVQVSSGERLPRLWDARLFLAWAAFHVELDG